MNSDPFDLSNLRFDATRPEANCIAPSGKSGRRSRRKSPALEFLNLPMSLLQKLAVAKAGWATWVMVCALHEAWFTTGVHCNHPNPLPISRVDASRWPLTRKQKSRALQFLARTDL